VEDRFYYFSSLTLPGDSEREERKEERPSTWGKKGRGENGRPDLPSYPSLTFLSSAGKKKEREKYGWYRRGGVRTEGIFYGHPFTVGEKRV